MASMRIRDAFLPDPASLLDYFIDIVPASGSEVAAPPASSHSASSHNDAVLPTNIKDAIQHQPTQCLVRVDWPEKTNRPLLHIDTDETSEDDRQATADDLKDLRPSQPYQKAIGLTIRSLSWREYKDNTITLLKDLDADMPLSVPSAVSILHMISPGRSKRKRGSGDGDEAAGDCWKRTDDGVYSMNTEMGFEQTSDLGDHMGIRRFLVGLALFDADDRAADRRSRTTYIGQAWRVVQDSQHLRNAFEIHAMPVTPAPVFHKTLRHLEGVGPSARWCRPQGRAGGPHERWAGGYVVMDLLHKSSSSEIRQQAFEQQHGDPPPSVFFTALGGYQACVLPGVPSLIVPPEYRVVNTTIIPSVFFQGCTLLSPDTLYQLRQEASGEAGHGQSQTALATGYAPDPRQPDEEDAERQFWRVDKTNTFMSVIPASLNTSIAWMNINMEMARAGEYDTLDTLPRKRTRRQRPGGSPAHI
ncbi:hypothetical protein ACHAPU_001987 [Fusarium lateritium]